MEPLPVDKFAEGVFSGVSERRVTHVVAQTDGFSEVLVQTEIAGDRSPDLGDLKGMSQPGDVVITLWIDEDLRFVLQPTERLRVDDAVAIALERRSIGAGELGKRAPPRLNRQRRRR